ncbi:MAG: DNA repair protein RadA, partial [Gemmatimonadetes bacterium]|nr:DNA repair protein RadA [Gemmatimonadota bacterium]
ASLASSVYDRPLPRDAVFVGEVGLGGEIRSVSQIDRRLAEAEKMGMRVAYVSERGLPRRATKALKVVGVRDITTLLRELFT